VHTQELAGKQLDAARKETEGRVKARTMAVTAGGGKCMVATDAWKRRVAAGGAPLMNCMLLLPDGGSIFLEVKDCSGEKKDAAWVAEEHKQLAVSILKGDDKSEQVCACMQACVYACVFLCGYVRMRPRACG
jgi:hypothetical protein